MTVALLVAGTASAIVLTQHLRHDGPVVSNINFKRQGHRACFSLTRADTVQVEVVDSSERIVRVLAPAQRLEGGTDKADAHCYDWDGTDEAGNPVGPGVYRLRFELEDADRVATSGEHLTIPATEPPS